MTPDLYRAIQNRDSEMLSRIAGDSYDDRKVVNTDAEELVDMLFENLMQVFPASTQTNLRTDDDIRVAKQQWIAAFAESGITSREQLSAGMQKARSSQSPFWPSPGQFISWCRDGSGALGVSVDDIMSEYSRWRKLVFRYPTSEQYPWPAPVLYHICIELRRQSTDRQMTEKELRQAASKVLAGWEKRAAEGKPVPPVRRALAAPAKASGPTPAELLLAQYKQRKDAGLI